MVMHEMIDLIHNIDSWVGRVLGTSMGGRGFNPWPCHTEDGIKMVPVAPSFGRTCFCTNKKKTLVTWDSIICEVSR